MTDLNQVAQNPSPSHRDVGKLSSRFTTAYRTYIYVTAFILSILSLGLIALTFQYPYWQLYVVAGVMTIAATYSRYIFSLSQKKQLTTASLGYLSAVIGVTWIIVCMMIRDVSLGMTIIYMIFSLILASIIQYQTINRAIVYGLFTSILISLAGVYSPFAQLAVQQINLSLPVLVGSILMIYIAMLTLEFANSSLQVRLTSAFIAAVIIPLSFFSVIQGQYTITSLRDQISDSVELSSSLVASSLDQFIKENEQVVNEEARYSAFAKYLNLPKALRPGSQEQRDVQQLFRVLQNRESTEKEFLSSYAMLDMSGKVLFDTNFNNTGKNEGGQKYFTDAILSGKSFSTPITFTKDGNSYIIFSAPILNDDKDIVGVLRFQYNGLIFQRLLAKYSGLYGPKSYVMLFDENNIRLADTFTPEYVYTTINRLSPAEKETLDRNNRLPIEGLKPFYTDQPDLARYMDQSDVKPKFSMELTEDQADDTFTDLLAVSRMRERPWKVVYLYNDFDDTPLRNSQNKITTVVATLVAGLIGILAILVSSFLTRPIRILTNTADQITAGNFNIRTPVTTLDEFGTLGRAFNLMTERLNQFINELEDRVAQRTNELASRNDALSLRSTQLQTVADVARNIVTSQELQSLLDTVTQLISERFNFYHVGVFLLDENSEYAVLRAANSDGGKRMLARQHRLRVGKVGIVGYATGTGQPRIATDVGEDAVYFNNPDLPDTRSEMALPLKVGGRIIGALDVQSNEPGVFSPEDIDLFSTLADQVAIAIYNNQLYSETAKALAEAQSIHRQYLRQEWRQDIATRRNKSFRFTPQGLVAKDVSLSNVKEVMQTGKPFVSSEIMDDQSTNTVMGVPIILRGETIGVIRVQDQGEDRVWTEDELQAVQEVAQQVGVALETARLFEKTVQRAEREKKVLEITGMIRATNNPQQMLEIATRELQKALGASRAQIFIRQNSEEDELNSTDASGNNGHNR